MNLSGKAKLAGVMGWPISHSRSPLLHGYWLRELNIDGTYLPLAVDPENIEAALRALPILGISGVNLTVPHKELAMSVCDHIDSIGRRIGAVNTIVVNDDGTLSGTNTDAFGFLENLRTESAWRASDGPALVLGAGGAARAIVAALIDDGIGEVRLANRTLSRAEALAAEFGRAVTTVPWDQINAAMDGTAVLVNTSTLGMTGQPDLELDLHDLPATAVVNDIVYSPLETTLLRKAKTRGNSVVDGLGMLLHQARPGFTAWFGEEPTVSDGLRAHILADLSA
ncbi:MAG: shikimate dehydrogenase [Alphaproteobacteria bacterium]|nr:shikimate dehydrogenase [Alphaproteobacteria bacterium]